MFRSKILLFIYIFTLFVTSTLYAEKIRKIDVVGLKRSNIDYIKSILAIKVGDNYSEDLLNKSLEVLYSGDIFKSINVKHTKNSGVITLIIEENPLLQDVQINGNSEIKSEDIKAELLLVSGGFLSELNINLDKRRILDLYKKNGFLKTKVETKITKRSEDVSSITFNIVEGPKSQISVVRFSGNKVFSATQLKSTILTKESKWWRFLSPTGTYDENRIAYDGELLRKFYSSMGYINFKVTTYYTELLPDGTFAVNFNLEEGKRYRLGYITIKNNVPDIDDIISDLYSKLSLKEDEWLNIDRIIANKNNLQNYLVAQGNQLINVDFKYEINDVLKIVNVTYSISKSVKKRVRQIHIVNNSKTYDYVIRRLMEIDEADTILDSSINNSKYKIQNTGYFSAVELNRVSINSDEDDIYIKVEETSTGSIYFQGGYTTSSSGLTVGINYSESNFMGKGITLNISGDISQDSTVINTTLGTGHLFNRNLYGSVSFYSSEYEATDQRTYTSQTLGMNLFISYSLSLHLNQSWRYAFTTRSEEGSNTSEYYEGFLDNQSITSSISHTLTYDNRNNYFYPTSGYELSTENTFSGLGGNVEYLKNKFTVQYYKELFIDDVVLSVVGEMEFINSYTDDLVPISSRLVNDADDLRGFEERGIGPRFVYKDYDGTILQTYEAVGGNERYRLSLQVDVPIPTVDNYGLIFHIFNDNMVIRGIDIKEGLENIEYESNFYDSIRSTAGFGFKWRSPFGMIALDWGWALKKKSYDHVSLFNISYGSRL